MTCRDATHAMCQYLEGALEPRQTRLLERHLDACSDCQQVISTACDTLQTYFSVEPQLHFLSRARTQPV